MLQGTVAEQQGSPSSTPENTPFIFYQLAKLPYFFGQPTDFKSIGIAIQILPKPPSTKDAIEADLNAQLAEQEAFYLLEKKKKRLSKT